MDYKKTNAPTTTVTQNILELCEDTGNIYESVTIIAKRANQISVDIKTELSKKLQEFASSNDNLDEVFVFQFFHVADDAHMASCLAVESTERVDGILKRCAAKGSESFIDEQDVH